jgi:Flp pilus assembly pilin Flp
LLAGLDPIARTIVAVFETIGKAIGGVALAIVEVAQGNFKTAGAAIKETFIGIGETIDEQFGKFGALQGFADTLGEVKNRAGDAFATFQTGAQRAGEITNATTGKTK